MSEDIKNIVEGSVENTDKSAEKSAKVEGKEPNKVTKKAAVEEAKAVKKEKVEQDEKKEAVDKDEKKSNPSEEAKKDKSEPKKIQPGLKVQPNIMLYKYADFESRKRFYQKSTYVWGTIEINGKVAVTDKFENVKKPWKIIGWVKVAEIKQ